MSDTHAQTAFVRHVPLPERAPPAEGRGMLEWVRASLFNTWVNAILTLIAIYLIFRFAAAVLPWFSNAVWNADSLSECRELGTGACFAVIRERWQQFLFGFYPQDQYWRPVLTCLLMLPAVAPVLFGALPRRMLWFSALFPVLAYWLIWGGPLWSPLAALAALGPACLAWKLAAPRIGRTGALVAGVAAALLWLEFAAEPLARGLQEILPVALDPVASRRIGGFTLTLIVGVTSIALSLPLGILLALGRQSRMWVIRTLSIGFIEFIRGVPLIALLFVASVMLAYFLPPGTSFDLVLRVIIMVTLFASAYIAEVIRGGLAALPRGQYEAADAIGLDYWQAMRLVILPQALKISIPGIVNVFIGLFKDTTLVSIIGLLDPLGLTTAVRATTEWNGVIWELYGFIALIFFIFCFGMSKYSQYLERRLQTERH
jgi:general L-amino acid transport system permease protein